MSKLSIKQLLSSKNSYWFIALVITFIALSPTLNNTWVNWDDDAYVIENNLIKSLDTDGIIAIFSEPNVVGNYHPFTVLSLAVDYAISGKNPFTYHLHSLLLHLLNVFLVFFFVSRLVRSHQIAFIAAILFGIHPMHVESIAWISARKDLLYTAYLLLGLISYLTYSERKSVAKKRGWYLLSFVLFSCALLSKGAAMVFPAYLFLIDYLQHKKITISYIANKLPFIALSAIFVYISFYSQQLEGAFISDVSIPILDRFAIASTSFLVYLIKSIIPIGLSPFHPYPFQQLIDFPTHYYFSLIAIPSLLAFSWIAYRKKWKVALFGVLFFTATLIPLLQLIPLGRAMMAERYTYFAYIGLFILFGFLVDQFIHQNPNKKRMILGAFMVIVTLFSSISYGYSKSWKNGFTLWSKVIDEYPEDYYGYCSRAEFFFKTGNFDNAIIDLDQSISLYPYYGISYHLKGKILEKSNELQMAANNYEKAISLTPNFNPPYVNLARILGADGQYEAALKYLNQVLILNPNYSTALINRAVINERLKNQNQAITDYNAAIKLEPNNALYYRYRGVNYLANGDADAAISDFNTVIQLLPTGGLTYFLRAKALLQKGLKTEAKLDAQKAIDLNYPVDQSFINELK